jgi:hypothetical protein
MPAPFVARVLLAHALFFILLAVGWRRGQLWGRGILMFLAAWLAGIVAATMLPGGALLFTAYVAIMDVVLILIIFKGDIRI